jgi:hypothetical protein
VTGVSRFASMSSLRARSRSWRLSIDRNGRSDWPVNSERTRAVTMRRSGLCEAR